MQDTYNDGYKTEDIRCIIVDFIAEDGKGGLPIMRQGTYVLCKDCKYCDRHHLVDGLFCYRLYEKYKKEYPQMIIEIDADDFCSKGERRGKEI